MNQKYKGLYHPGSPDTRDFCSQKFARHFFSNGFHKFCKVLVYIYPEIFVKILNISDGFPHFQLNLIVLPFSEFQIFDKYGTFNKDHEPIFKVIKTLSTSEIIRLHKDFGTRLYNPVTRTYKLFSVFGWRGYSQEKGLNALFDSEYDENQLQLLTDIYKEKGLEFPYLGSN